MTVAKNIKEALAGSSFIRKMFEEGIEMREKYGADNAFDFSLGNPDLPPPPVVKETLLNLINRSKITVARTTVPAEMDNTLFIVLK